MKKKKCFSSFAKKVAKKNTSVILTQTVNELSQGPILSTCNFTNVNGQNIDIVKKTKRINKKNIQKKSKLFFSVKFFIIKVFQILKRAYGPKDKTKVF